MLSYSPAIPRHQLPLAGLVPTLFAACLPGLAAAEEEGRPVVPPAPEPVAADPIVIAGEEALPYHHAQVDAASKTAAPLTEVPQSVSTIDEEQIAIQGLTDFGQVFRYTPGVQGENFGFEPRTTFLRLRGFDAFEDGLFRDGMKLANPGFAVGYNPEPYGADRIDVLRGPASVLYGQAAPGGLVNYVSKRPQWRAAHEVYGTVGSYERLQARFDSTGPIDAQERVAYRLTGLLRDSQTQVDHVQDDRIYLAPAVSWRPTEATELTLLAHYQDDDTTPSQRYPVAGTLEDNPNGSIPTDRFLGEPAVDTYERTEVAVGGILTHRVDERWSVEQRLRWYGSDVDDRTIFPEFLQADQRTVTRSLYESFGSVDGVTSDSQVQVQLRTGAVEHRLLAGLDLQVVGAETRQTYGFGGPADLDIFDPDYGDPVPDAPVFKDEESDLTQVGIYVQDELHIGEDWTAVFGLRHDWAAAEISDRLAGTSRDQDDEELTWRVGAIYESSVGLTPYASYMTSFLPQPSLGPDGEPFAPETGRQFEIGVKYEPAQLDGFITLAWFDLVREDFVTSDASFVDRQGGEARSQGLEAEIALVPVRGLQLLTSYTWMDTELTESDFPDEEGEALAYTPEHSGSIWADYSFAEESPVHGLNLGAGLRYIGENHANLFQQRNDERTVPSVTLVDAAVHYRWQGWQVGVTAHNLFDEEYVASSFGSFGSDFATYGQRLTVLGDVGYRW
ncbi:MAG: TonB-dependent siderophore receptor [Planctomycetota bacterium]